MAHVELQSQLSNGSNVAVMDSPTPEEELAMSVPLYVGDLDVNVTDDQLKYEFSQMGKVISVRVCRDLETQRSLGYAFVNFANPQDAERAIQEMNYLPLNGKPIRLSYSQRDPTVRQSGAGNIFVGNLEESIDHKALHDTFSTFGDIVSCKVALDSLDQSKGYGFVQYVREESAMEAIEKLNGMFLNGKQVYVGPFLSKQEREATNNKTKFTNVYVKNFTESTTDDDLKNAFGKYGKITSAVVMKDGDGNSKGFGFVNFENADSAAWAVASLNGHKFDDKEWYVGRALNKSERETELRVRNEQNLKEVTEKLENSNLYVKNLHPIVSDEKLKEIFSPFGTVTSCKVMREPNGISKGAGFVAFSTPEEASKAMSKLNGKMIESKPIYVDIAQRKEDRRVKLQAQFSQVRPVAMPRSVGPRMPMYPQGSLGMGQQMLYGQTPRTNVPHHVGFGYQQQLVPGMHMSQLGFGYQQQLVPGIHPGGHAVPNYSMPWVQQQHQLPTGGRLPGGIHQSRQQNPMMQQQMHPTDWSFQYSQGRGGSGDVFSYDIGCRMALNEALALTVANATSPEQRRTILGETLFPLVENIVPNSAPKVTGMLLEMDQTAVLHLIESPQALHAKVAEAMDILTSDAAARAAEQLASLNLS